MAPPHPYRHHPYAQPRNATAAEIATSVPPPSNPPTLVQTCRNRRASSINRVLWTPSSMTHRRLVTGSHNGEITLWNCDSFIHEGTFQAHECAIRSMKFTHDGEYIYMVSGDDGGTMRYWNREMTNVHVKDEAHQESIRDFSFAVTSTKLCSCSDDTTIKIWDFATCREVNRLTGHGWNVTSVDWHPTKGLVGSGGRDSCVKLWEPRIGMELCTFYDHKNWVNSVKWNKNGHWLLAASKDQTVKLFDMRVMKVLKTFRGHGSEVTALAWHPIQEEYFSSGSRDGSIFHWRVGSETPQAEVRDAHSGSHNNSVWDLQWHPSGDFLCSGSNDRTTKFWCNINVNGSFSDHNSASSDVMICDSSNEITPTVSLDSQKDGTIYIPGIGLCPSK